MPSTSAKQARTMNWAAHNPAFAKRMGIPQDVARKFVAADKKKPKGPIAKMARAAKRRRRRG